MTSDRVFFTAEQGDPAVQNLSLKPMYTIEKRPGSLDPQIVDAAPDIVELFPRGSSAQFQAEEQVPDPVARQGSSEILDVEVRSVSGVRARTDVHQSLDPLPLQQPDEFLRRMVGMSDREDRPPSGDAPGRPSLTLRHSLLVDT